MHDKWRTLSVQYEQFARFMWQKQQIVCIEIQNKIENIPETKLKYDFEMYLFNAIKSNSVNFERQNS